MLLEAAIVHKRQKVSHCNGPSNGAFSTFLMEFSDDKKLPCARFNDYAAVAHLPETK